MTITTITTITITITITGAGLRGAVREIFAPHSHDHADSVDDALASSAQGIRAVKISLLALGVTATSSSSSSCCPTRWRWPPTPFTTSPTR